MSRPEKASSIQVPPQESILVSAARTHLQLSRERRVAESALSCSNAASLKTTGSFRSNQNKRFGHAETQIWMRPLRIPWFCRNYSESTAHGARQIAISRRLLCASRARYRISFQPSRARTCDSKHLSGLCCTARGVYSKLGLPLIIVIARPGKEAVFILYEISKDRAHTAIFVTNAISFDTPVAPAFPNT